MINLLEYINTVATLLLLLITLSYYRSLRRKQKKGTLSTFEKGMYLLTTVANFLFVVSYFALYFGT